MIHRAAASGFERGSDHYRRGRPSYHPDLVARFASSFGDGPVVEIGAGTGIFTSQLLAAGIDVVAVEPVESMRAALLADHPDLDVRSGTAERLPVDTDACATVVVAQAFHWFDHGPALDEIDRVLRSGGHLVTVWNVKEGDAPWYQRYMAIIDRLADDTPRHRDQVWRRAIDADPRFRLVDDWQIDNTVPADLDTVVDRALSTSFIAALPEEEQASVAEEIRGALDGVELPVPFPYRGELQAWVTGHGTPTPTPA